MLLIGCSYHCPDQPSGKEQLNAHDNERCYPAEELVAEQDIQGKVGQSEQTSA
ncbi:hypothetical protein [Parabacteroides distasonis]|uniref:hypothetical protein n=1 Tax=Parabacteroides distasonis TaxID=823 RepID=UPI00333E7548|nr:hypothetical protein [Parabacteroides distasonis]